MFTSGPSEWFAGVPQMDTATIQVPATTANLGPGYDCLGVALTIYNRVTVPGAASGRITPAPRWPRRRPRTFSPRRAANRSRFDWTIEGAVPRSRGIGSSVTVRLGPAAWVESPCRRSAHGAQRLFEICAALEGHPDNAAPAAFGGFVVSGPASVARFEVEERLQFVLLVPPFEVATPEARRVLPAADGPAGGGAELRQCLPDHRRVRCAELRGAARRSSATACTSPSASRWSLSCTR